MSTLNVGTVNIWEVPGYRIEMSPFGGIKDSGYGKEAGIESIKEYTRIKTTWYNSSDKPMTDPFTMG